MAIQSPFVADKSVSKDYRQYLADLGTEDQKDILADEYACRLDEEVDNVFLSIDDTDLYGIADAYSHVNDTVMYDVTTVIKSDMYDKSRGMDKYPLDYDLKNLSQDVLLAGASNIDYAAPRDIDGPDIEREFDAECVIFKAAYMDKHLDQVDRLGDAMMVSNSLDSVEAKAYYDYQEIEDCKQNSLMGEGYARPHMPMTTESATRAFEKLDRDKDAAIELHPERESEILEDYTGVVDFCSDAWGDMGVDVEAAQYDAGINRSVELGETVHDFSTRERSAAEVEQEAADLAPQEDLEAETETMHIKDADSADKQDDDIMRGEELDNYVADLKSGLAESRQQKREEAGLSMNKDEVAAAYEDPRFAELKRYTEERRGEKIGPDKDQATGLEM